MASAIPNSVTFGLRASRATNGAARVRGDCVEGLASGVAITARAGTPANGSFFWAIYCVRADRSRGNVR